MKPRRRKSTTASEELPPVDGVEVEGAAEAEVTVEGIEPAPEKSGPRKLADRLKSALLGGGSGEDDEAPAVKATVSKKRQDDIANQLMIMFAIVVTWLMDSMFNRFSPEYIDVAPTTPEAQAMTLPPASIIARRIKAAGKVNPDTLDYLLMITAIGIYADRARDTAREITRQKREREANAVDASGYSRGGPLAPQTAYHSYSQNSGVYGATQSPNGQGPENDGSAAAGQNGTRSSSDARNAVDPMDELLRADAIGRKERGLI